MLIFFLGVITGYATLIVAFLTFVYHSLERQNKEFDEWKSTLKKPPK